MQVNSINNQSFGKIIFKDNTRSYVMDEIIPSVIPCHHNNSFYDKFDKVSASDKVDIIVEKCQARNADCLLMGVKKDGKYVKSAFHYCLNDRESRQELYDTFHELLDFALYGKPKHSR